MYYLPSLAAEAPHSQTYQDFAQELRRQGYAGQLDDSISTRLSYATDNSVYQITPQLILKPRDRADVIKVMALLAHPDFAKVQLAPRGGGSGTNGQSLHSGCLLDLSAHLNAIVDINPRLGEAIVQPGVTLAQLNSEAGKHGLKFGPSVSTADRATIGGMVSTDASGKGSCVYGKCSDHLLELEFITLGGQSWNLREWQLAKIEPDEQHYALAQLLASIHQQNRDEIKRRFPDLNREVTGYNLKQMFTGRSVNPLKLIAGSEGSLGVVTSIKVKLVPIPKHTSVCLVCYGDFYHTLCSGVELRSLKPDAIETMDKTLVQLAQQHQLGAKLGELWPRNTYASLGGINCLELSADSEIQLFSKQRKLEQILQQDIRVIHYAFADKQASRALWNLRAQAVGLLGRLDEFKQPISGLEDCAVPPESIPKFVLELSSELNRQKLAYGIYGHIDAGCLHLRPALDTRDPDYRNKLRQLSDYAYQLCCRYGGVFWGEHGKGIRSEYAPEFFGAQLYKQMQRIKRYFDPRNQLNAGKVATPMDSTAELLRLDQAPMKVSFDRQVTQSNRSYFRSAFSCNGNGLCFSSKADAQMCPSYQLTGDRVHSPKGRATLVREWLRLLSNKEFDLAQTRARRRKLSADAGPDFSHQVAQAFRGCLGCSACTSQCPVQLNIPDLRSTFFHVYHSRYKRPMRDYLINRVESLSSALAPFALICNPIISSAAGRKLAEKVGLVDLPSFDQGLKAKLKSKLRADVYSENQLQLLLANSDAHSVVLIADPYLNAYDNQPLVAAYKLIASLGWRPMILKLRALGKAAHVIGMLQSYSQRRQRNQKILQQLTRANLPIIVTEPSALYFLHEQVDAVQHPAHWLLQQALPPIKLEQESRIQLLRHCTEASRDDGRAWTQLYQHFGLQLELAHTGCCGRAGLYGHLRENQQGSKQLYQRNWERSLSDKWINLATGYSCRAYTRQLQHDLVVDHPLSYLQRLMQRHYDEQEQLSLG